MDVGERSTTLPLSDFGGRTHRRRCISTTMRHRARRVKAQHVKYHFTTMNGHTRRWSTARQPHGISPLLARKSISAVAQYEQPTAGYVLLKPMRSTTAIVRGCGQFTSGSERASLAQARIPCQRFSMFKQSSSTDTWQKVCLDILSHYTLCIYSRDYDAPSIAGVLLSYNEVIHTICVE